jgi:hypothetical protein
MFYSRLLAAPPTADAMERQQPAAPALCLSLVPFSGSAPANPHFFVSNFLKNIEVVLYKKSGARLPGWSGSAFPCMHGASGLFPSVTEKNHDLFLCCFLPAHRIDRLGRRHP